MQADSTYNNIDVAYDFRIPDLATITKSKFKVIIQPAQSFSHMELNQSYAPFRDVRVRQALQYAIDKAQYIKSLFAGQPLDAATIKTLSLNTVIQGSSSFS